MFLYFLFFIYMATNKKPKKAYKPKPIYNHTLIGGMAVFDPIKQALLKIKNGQLVTDESGVASVTTIGGEQLGFSEGLLRVVDLLEVYHTKYAPTTRMIVAMDAIKKLSVSLKNQDYVFDEEVIDQALKEIEHNSKILAYLTPRATGDLIRNVRIMNLMQA